MSGVAVQRTGQRPACDSGLVYVWTLYSRVYMVVSLALVAVPVVLTNANASTESSTFPDYNGERGRQ
jgi:hypothetical protein